MASGGDGWDDWDNWVPAPTKKVEKPPQPFGKQDAGQAWRKYANNLGPADRKCADCDQPDAQWLVGQLGIFICIQCAGLYRSLGAQCIIRSKTMDIITMDTMNRMKCGGNVPYKEFLTKHGVKTRNLKIQYESAAVKAYINKLNVLAAGGKWVEPPAETLKFTYKDGTLWRKLSHPREHTVGKIKVLADDFLDQTDEPYYYRDDFKLTGHRFIDLPKEIYGLILQYIWPQERMRLRAVCKSFHLRLKAWSPLQNSCFLEMIEKGETREVWGKYSLYPVIILTTKFNKSCLGYQLASFISYLNSPLEYNRDARPQIIGCDDPITITRTKHEHAVNFETFKVDRLERKHLFAPVLINNFGMTQGNHLSCHVDKRSYIRSECWQADTTFYLNDGTPIAAKFLSEGDQLLSSTGEPTTVKQIKSTSLFRPCKMVIIDDFLITPGHPVFMNGAWYRPDEISATCNVYIDTVYNLYCEPNHFLCVGSSKIICSSLGGVCPRLAAIDPVSDLIYGSGYGTPKAKRYEWLLNREPGNYVPNHLIEQETVKYWEGRAF